MTAEDLEQRTRTLVHKIAYIGNIRLSMGGYKGYHRLAYGKAPVTLPSELMPYQLAINIFGRLLPEYRKMEHLIPAPVSVSDIVQANQNFKSYSFELAEREALPDEEARRIKQGFFRIEKSKRKSFEGVGEILRGLTRQAEK